MQLSCIKILLMRNTKARNQILSIFTNTPYPVSAMDLLKEVKVNKTTIYRELSFLENTGFIKEVDFGDGKKRYELKEARHHHHLVCLDCKKVTDIEIEENFKLPREFKVIKHNLEFFGLCVNCQK